MIAVDSIGGIGGIGDTPPPPSKPPEPPSSPSSAGAPPDSCARTAAQPPSLMQALFAANAPAGSGSNDPSALSIGSGVLKGVATADSTGWFPQGPLPPNAQMVDAHGYRYTSDMFGRPTSASGDLTLNTNPSATRDAAARANQAAAGGPDRLVTDQGGHGLANGFFGRNDAWNLTPQDGNLNHSAYRVMENSWRNTLQNPGGSVSAAVRNVYDEPTLRPIAYVSRYSLNGNAPKLRVMENAPNAGFTSAVEGIGKNESMYARLGKMSEGLETLGKVAAPVAIAADGLQLYSAYKQDGGTIGTHTLEAGGSVAGGWAGAVAGSEIGAEGGAAVGAWFGGVGAVPGAIIGVLVGGAVGGIVGSDAGKDVVKLGESAAGALKDAGNTVVNAGKSVVDGIGSAGSTVVSLGSKALSFIGL